MLTYKQKTIAIIPFIIGLMLITYSNPLSAQHNDIATTNYYSPAQTLDDIRYFKKSISHLDTIIVLQNNAQDFNTQQGLVWLKKNLTMTRFDTNPLPENIRLNISKDTETIKTLNPEVIAQLLKRHVSSYIKTQLSDATIQKERIEANTIKKNVTFAETKGKSAGLTINELSKLMRSAFIYVPYVSNATSSMTKEKKVNEDDEIEIELVLNYQITGGIIWFQMIVEEDGKTVTINPIKTLSASQKNKDQFSAGVNTQLMMKNLQNETWKSWAETLAFQTKSIESFKLSTPIHEQKGHRFTIPLGSKENISKDSYFFLMENSEVNGQITSTAAGLMMIKNVDKHTETTPSLSEGTLRKGDDYALYSWVKEDPRIGIEASLSVSHTPDISIKKEDSYIAEYSENYILNRDANLKHVVTLGLDINLAKYINTSQFFLFIDLDVMPVTQLVSVGGLPYYASTTVGLKKRIWRKDRSITFGSGFARNYFSIPKSGQLKKFEMSSISFKNKLSIEKLITFRTSIFATFTHNTVIKKPKINLNFNDSEISQKSALSTLSSHKFSVGLKVSL